MQYIHKKNLFEMLSNADQERIHTQTIAWLLNPADSPLNDGQIERLYANLFGNKAKIKINQDLEVSTEYDHIDLVIQDSANIIAIENKLKSQQSEDQLKKYSEKLKQINKSGKIITRFFLTFSDEISQSEDWVNLEYKAIHNSIASLESNNIYVKDYQTLLKRMLEAKDYFLSDGCDRFEVMRRSGLPTNKRFADLIKSDNEHIKYICNNKLERLFIEMYYRKIMSKLGVEKWKVEESHGNALIQVYFERINCKYKDIKLVPGFQLQKNTIKYNIHEENYKSSRRENFPKELIELLETQFFKKENGFRKNEGKTKAYLSFSYPIEPKSFLCGNIRDTVSFIGDKIKECEMKWQEVRAHLN